MNGFKLSHGACLNGVAFCRQTDCRHHLAGSQPFGPGRKTKQPPHFIEPCVLRISATGPISLQKVGEMLGVTRERVRQIEEKALRKLARLLRLGVFGLSPEDLLDRIATKTVKPETKQVA